MNITKIVEKGIKEYNKNKFRESIVLYKKAIKSTNHPQINATIYYNIGLSYYSLFDYNQAAYYFEKSFKSGNLKSGWELSMSKLHLGEIKGLEYFSFRYFGNLNSFPELPLKKISSIEDIEHAKNILVLNEQGFGDEILFCRGLQLLENKKFSYQVYQHMMQVFKENFDYNFFEARILDYNFVMSHDAWIPTGDLFKLHTLHNGFSYKPFKSETTSNKIGICFKTNKLSKNSNLRSLNYDELKKILTKFEFNYISLQKDFEFDFAENRPIANFSDTSRIIDECQFIITVDTAIAHLAAIKNKKVYLVWKEYKDWRWNYPFYGTNIELVNFKDLENKLISLK